MTERQVLTGFGRSLWRDCRIYRPDRPGHIRVGADAAPVIARGAGCGYGDCALQQNGVVTTAALDKFLSFDPASGVLAAEAGVTMAQILNFCVPRGFFPPVTPGTKIVTLGGMIAADVHGKNHHVAGSFGDHVLWLDLLTPSGEVRRCMADQDALDFQLTLGGMGLTGIVLAAAIRLDRIETGYISQTIVPAPNLDQTMAEFERHADKPYSVAWIDCLARGDQAGRAVVMVGEHTPRAGLPARSAGAPLDPPLRRPKRMPFDLPTGLLNRWSASLFNRFYYWNHQRNPGALLIDYDRYFYPLDAVLDWNRVYGKRGFLQYQCVLPKAASREGLSMLLDRIAASGQGPFLAVLKLLGQGASDRPLSFPIEGYTLALDFPKLRGLPDLLGELDAIVRDHGGRHYLAKDAHITRETFDAGYGDAAERFRQARAASGADQVFRSALSERLEL